MENASEYESGLICLLSWLHLESKREMGWESGQVMWLLRETDAQTILPAVPAAKVVSYWVASTDLLFPF